MCLATADELFLNRLRLSFVALRAIIVVCGSMLNHSLNSQSSWATPIHQTTMSQQWQFSSDVPLARALRWSNRKRGGSAYLGDIPGRIVPSSKERSMGRTELAPKSNGKSEIDKQISNGRLCLWLCIGIIDSNQYFTFLRFAALIYSAILCRSSQFHHFSPKRCYCCHI